MSINLQLPKKNNLKPSITVFGAGGAGGNAVNNMINAKLEGINFVVANTDAQSLENSRAEQRIQLGENITQGLGAGSYPEVGKAAAEEAVEQIMDHINGSNMIFIAAGMGGGTGTGAAPVIARLAREQGILTVAVVTKPFHFEGSHRMRVAELGLQELQKYVDTLIVTPNQNLFRIADKNTSFQDAFSMADDVLRAGVQGITDLMVMPGLINLDFSDIRSVMGEMGKAMMGTGEAEGDNRATGASEAAISNPLLDNVSMQGARGVLINISGGGDMTLFEVDEAANRIREEVDPEANIIFGATFDPNLEGKVRVSVVATGIDAVSEAAAPPAGSAASEEEKEERAFGHIRERFSIIEGITSDEEFEQPEAGFSEQENADSAIEDEGTFVAPDPVEPQQQPVAPQFASAAAESNDAEEGELPFASNATNASQEEAPEKPAARGLGIFGLRAKKAEAAPVEAEEGNNELEDILSSIRVKEQEEEEGGLPKEDIFDIPAFLRRK